MGKRDGATSGVAGGSRSCLGLEAVCHEGVTIRSRQHGNTPPPGPDDPVAAGSRAAPSSGDPRRRRGHARPATVREARSDLGQRSATTLTTAPLRKRLPSHAVRRRVAVATVSLATIGGLVFAARTDASIERGDPGARLPAGALAGEYWDLVARFESGHLLVATTVLANTGPGGRTAVVVGQLVEPGGRVHPFSRSEREGGWRLEDDGRRLDLQSIVLDQSGHARRFVVDKNELGIDVAIEGAGAPAWPAQDTTPGCGFDVLDVAGAATGTFRSGRAAAPVALRGLAALTHRWTPGLEVDCLRRGVELFAMQPGLGLYFRESETPSGAREVWLLVRRDGRTVFQGVPSESALGWRAGAPGYPDLAWLRFTAPGLAGRAEFGKPLGVFEPFARLPAPLRAALELRTRPRLAWSTPSFELRTGQRSLRGGALAKLAWTNPQPASDAGGSASAAAVLAPGRN